MNNLKELRIKTRLVNRYVDSLDMIKSVIMSCANLERVFLHAAKHEHIIINSNIRVLQRRKVRIWRENSGLWSKKLDKSGKVGQIRQIRTIFEKIGPLSIQKLNSSSQTANSTHAITNLASLGPQTSHS